MSIEKLTAYTTIGAEHQKQQELRLEKIKSIVSSLSDDEFEQLMDMSKAMNDKQMLHDLPIWRTMVKK